MLLRNLKNGGLPSGLLIAFGKTTQKIRRCGCAETIYQAVYVYATGELNPELAASRRRGRKRRKPRKTATQRTPRFVDKMVPISKRPTDVDDRVVPGHWEGDLIAGAQNRSAVATLVERNTRYVVLGHLPDNHGAGAVPVHQPRVDDKRVDENGERKRFASATLPRWARKSADVSAVLPLLYLRGLSTNDFGPALEQFLGSGHGLSASAIAVDHPVAGRGHGVP